ncbi:FHA domain-containing protein [Chloroflexales bacterium ZM16-3]|nr:FHA domain-containing protein [Chloroflexales bacterium ZM16-3]
MRPYWMLILIAVGLLLPSAPQINAQSNDWTLVTINTVATEQADGVDVDIYFTLRDRQGHFVPPDTASINETAQIQMQTGLSTAPQQAKVETPKTPISLILLIDTSGSMIDSMERVLAAAQKSVDDAPAGAAFSVFAFNKVDLGQQFTPLIANQDNRETVKQVIGGIKAQPGGMTCLYNAAYQALGNREVQVVQKHDRRAMILFTDGRDETGNDNQSCSTFDQAAVEAEALKYHTPIHTIGLCNSADCANVDQESLKALANNTMGFPAFGDVNQIDAQFKTIMAGINAQWVVRARVSAAKGENRGTVMVSSDKLAQMLSGTFTFSSSRDYAPAPNIVVREPRYSDSDDHWQLPIEISNPQTIAKIEVSVLEKSTGGLLLDPISIPITQTFDTLLPMTISIPADKFTPGEEYCFNIRARGPDGSAIKQPTETISGQTAELLVERCITHKPNVNFEIIEVTPKYDTGKLLTSLKITGIGQSKPLVSGEIIDHNGNQIAKFDPITLPEDRQIVRDLPQALLDSAAGDYTLRLTLDLGATSSKAERQFPYNPPAGPNRWPMIALILLAVIITGGSAYVYYKQQKAKPTTLPAPRPIRDTSASPIPPAAPSAPQKATTVVDKEGLTVRFDSEDASVGGRNRTSAQVSRARVRVLRTLAGNLPPEQLVTSFPSTIGRAGDLLIIGDKQVSRKHIELNLHNGVLNLTDLGSGHGTFINQRKIEPQTPQVLDGPTRIRLGPNTEIEIIPQTT